jgi:hypothetical protein
MAETALNLCPKCGRPFQLGFAVRSHAVSFVAPEKLKQFAFVDEDLVQSGWRNLFPSKAEYFRSYLCRECKIYLLDFSTKYDRHQANELAQAMDEPA